MGNKAVPSEFKWRHYEPEIILPCVRRYSCFSLSYRNLETILKECGLDTDHTTIYRWVQHYAPELEKKIGVHVRNLQKPLLRYCVNNFLFKLNFVF